MSLKHNKKRNTAFLYETLLKELTKSVVSGDTEKKWQIINLMKEFFNAGTNLHKELVLYKSLNETNQLAPHTAEKLVYEIRLQHSKLDKKKIFSEQSALIKEMNKTFSKGVFSNFVANYKSLATIYQIFNEETPTKSRVLLEENILKTLTSEKQEEEQAMKPIDNIVYKQFVQKFNEEYSDKLCQEQKELLNKYIASFLDNGIELKVYLNEELTRLKNEVKESMKIQEVKEDEEMMEKTKSVAALLESFKEKQIDKEMIEKVLKIQELAKEINA